MNILSGILQSAITGAKTRPKGTAPRRHGTPGRWAGPCTVTCMCGASWTVRSIHVGEYEAKLHQDRFCPLIWGNR